MGASVARDNISTRLLGASAAVVACAVGEGVAQDSGETTAQRAIVEEVLITARRREEGLQDTPLAVTAIDQEAFTQQNLNEIGDLRFTAPNVVVQKNAGLPNGAQIYIRGVGQDDSALTAEAGVGVYVDGVYLGKQNGTTLDLVELERVELLRGPQGTYYGRNTNGGAIKFVTRRPELQTPRFVADMRFGSDATVDLRGSISAPILADRLGFKLDAFVRRRESDYTLLNAPDPVTVLNFDADDEVNDLFRIGGRGSLLWEATPDVTVYIAADFVADESGAFLPTPIQRADARGTPDLADDLIVEPFGRRAGETSIPPFHDYRGGGVSMQIDWSTPFGVATAISAYRGFNQDYSADLDGPGILDAYLEIEQRQFTQELQFVGEAGAFEYVVGAYLFREDAETLAENLFNRTFAFFLNTPFGANFDNQRSTSYAVFGELSYSFLDQFTLTAGARFTRDEKTIDRTLRPFEGGDPFFAVSPDFEHNDVSPRVTAEWAPSRDVLVYASWSQGYKAGGFAGARPLTAANANATYAAEELSAYEAGLKLDLLQGRLRINPVFFYSDYKDLQLAVLDPRTLQFDIVNADARIQGIELEAEAQPTRGLRLFTVFGWTDFEYDEGSRVDPAVGVPYDQLEGKQFPEFGVRGGAVYARPTSFLNGEAQIGAFVTHTTEIFRNVANDLAIRSEPETLIDAFIAYTLQDGRYRLQLQVQNLTNEDYFVAGTSPSAMEGALGGRYYAPDRQVTVNLRAVW